jgi:intracellular multiplication protein IcmQ
MADDNKDSAEKLRSIIREIIHEEQALRDKYQIGDKFRFIREKLAALQVKIQSELQEIELKTETNVSELAADEMLVYVYLFNTQGLSLPTWQKLLLPSVFYEYSVNRPIYQDKNQIESFIRSRTNKVQHAYLTVAIKKEALLTMPVGVAAQDAIGNPLCKIKEGALKFERLLGFRHDDQDYVIKEDGRMVKKE